MVKIVPPSKLFKGQIFGAPSDNLQGSDIRQSSGVYGYNRATILTLEGLDI
jgi:hypothetical protein